MKLDDVNLLSFIPQFMQQDETTKAFVYAICSKLQIVIDDIKNASIYSRIDELSENVLDMIAEQFNISEYNLSYDISIKRSLIKNCMLIHHQRGTVGAVEKIVNDVFGDGRVEEWFNYDGSPYYFKVYTSNASSSDEMLKEFEYLGEEKAYEVVVTNTNKIADMCEKISPISPEKCPPYIEGCEETIKTIAYKKAHEL